MQHTNDKITPTTVLHGTDWKEPITKTLFVAACIQQGVTREAAEAFFDKHCFKPSQMR